MVSFKLDVSSSSHKVQFKFTPISLLQPLEKTFGTMGSAFGEYMAIVDDPWKLDGCHPEVSGSLFLPWILGV